MGLSEVVQSSIQGAVEMIESVVRQILAPAGVGQV